MHPEEEDESTILERMATERTKRTNIMPSPQYNIQMVRKQACFIFHHIQDPIISVPVTLHFCKHDLLDQFGCVMCIYIIPKMVS